MVNGAALCGRWLHVSRLSDANAADRGKRKKEIATKSEMRRAKKRFAHTITEKEKEETFEQW